MKIDWESLHKADHEDKRFSMKCYEILYIPTGLGIPTGI